MSPSSQDFVTIVILTRDRCNELCDCLDSLMLLQYPKLEVFVYDNGSGDSTEKLISTKYLKVKYRRFAQNMGTCIPRNMGIAESKGGYIWFLDSDTCVVDSNIITRFIEILKNDNKIGAIGGEAIVDKSENITGVKALQLTSSGMHKSEIITAEDSRPYAATDTLATCNFFARREVLIDVGGFDPWYFFYREDQDISARIRRAGYKLMVLNAVPVIHRFSESFRKKDLCMIGRNQKYFLLKNYPVRKILMMPIYDLLYFFDPEKLKKANKFSRMDLGETKVITRNWNQNHRKSLKLGSLFKVLITGAEVLSTMVLGYVTVIPHIPRALKLRRSHSNFLDELDSAQSL